MTAHNLVLAATDFSPAARHAAERAARVAHETGAALSLLHVLPGGSLAELRQWLGAGHVLEQQLHADTLAQLQQAAQALQLERGVPVTTLQTSGVAFEEISREAERQDAAVMVLGARGMGFMRRLVLGSTSDRLLRRSTRPLLVVRQIPHEPYRRALVAIDFSPWSSAAVQSARRVAPSARLLLFSVFQVPFEDKLHFAGVDAATIEHYRRQARAQALQRLHALAQRSGLKAGEWEPQVAEGDASMRIVETEHALDSDLVVLGKHGQSATEELLLGSVTKHVLAEGSADVLVSTAREP
ncbi:MAG: universal stress protein [Proteobacteria bacterium]|jgi:nucleotide-binding universal stress UspA family protein|nr:universal stress protein [Pseudomonadota bacterium]